MKDVFAAKALGYVLDRQPFREPLSDSVERLPFQGIQRLLGLLWRVLWRVIARLLALIAK